MRLIKFRVRNYKSIKDSGWCHLASGITILAGKNESGKSATLEALQSFNLNEPVPEDATPILVDIKKPEVEMCFDIKAETLDEIAEESNATISQEMRKYILENGVTIIKHQDGFYKLESCLEDKISTLLNKERVAIHCEIVEEIVGDLSQIPKLSKVVKPNMDSEAVEIIQERVTQYINRAESEIPLIPEAIVQQLANREIERLKQENETLTEKPYRSEFLDKLIRHMPNILFFRESHILPFEVSFEEAKNHPAVQDFVKVSDLDLDEVIATRSNSQRLRNMLSEKSAEISGDFMGYWEQSKLDLVVEPGEANLRFGVKESESSLLFKPEQRSKGFQWFLSFYLRLGAEKDGEKIILIDEPGLYLHAKAQRDVLKVLEKISEESQVIFSTHSPYLIDAQHLDRIRLVLKNNKSGTQIENKIHKNTDSETLTPIITAIGLELSNDFSIAGRKNVLLEGISDYYYLRALSHYTNVETNDWSFIPCAGASTTSKIASLLIGWDLEFLAVLDNDKAGKKVISEFENKLIPREKHIVFISNDRNSSIEDLFTYDDFNNFVLDEEINEDKKIKNSKFVKINRDKVLLSKNFFEKVKKEQQGISLSENTVNNFKQVFEKIEAIFGEK